MDFFTSDQHFGHKNIIEFCNRPFSSVCEMDEAIVDRWNDVVGDEDTVYVVGDISFYNLGLTRRILGSLSGKKVLILGNHDKSYRRMKEAGFDEVYTRYEYSMPDGRKALLSHYPAPDSLIEHDILIHGHTHCKPGEAIKGKKFNVCVDAWDYRPVSLSTILNTSMQPARNDSCTVSIQDGILNINAKIHPEDAAGLFQHAKELIKESYNK